MGERLALKTEPFAAEREWTVEGVPVLSALAQVPEPEGKDRTARRIKRFYRLQCRAFLRYCEKCLLPQAAAEYRAALEASRPLPAFRAELSYRVTYSDGLSIIGILNGFLLPLVFHFPPKSTTLQTCVNTAATNHIYSLPEALRI